MPDATPNTTAKSFHHHLKKMQGRDPKESGRVSTPLEVLFDLVFATAFSVAANEVAHELAAAHYWAGLFGLAYASLAICWAWISFSWFASAFDTDDWGFRLATMVQMIGVMLLALGLPRLFASLEQGVHLDGTTMIIGYIVMRLASVSQWLRAAIEDPPRRRICLRYAVAITIAQLGWVTTIFLNLPVGPFIGVAVVLAAVEFFGPFVAESVVGGTPWHPHHMAERYSLFFTIALGEAVVGTVTSLGAAIGEQGWTLDAALVSVAGMGLTFGLWWIYYLVPSGQVLHHHRDRAPVWAYLQLLIVVAVFSTGAGLHVSATFLDHKAEIGVVPVLLCTEIPVAVFLAALYATYSYLIRQFEPFHLALAAASALVAVVAIIAALAGVNLAVCLVILMLAPATTVLGYEIWGHRSAAEALAKIE